MGFGLGAGLALGSNLLGGLIGGFSGQSGQKKHVKKVMGMYDALQGGNSYNFGLAQLYQEKVLERLKEGTEAAKAGIQRSGTLAKRSTVDAGKMLLSRGNQSAASRGLYNTTILDSNRRAAVSDTQRRLNEIELDTGSNMASLEERAAAQEAQAQSMLAQLQLARAESERLIGLDRISTFAGARVPTSGEIIGQGLAGLGSMGMGLLSLGKK